MNAIYRQWVRLMCYMGFHYHPDPITHKCWYCGKELLK